MPELAIHLRKKVSRALFLYSWRVYTDKYRQCKPNTYFSRQVFRDLVSLTHTSGAAWWKDHYMMQGSLARKLRVLRAERGLTLRGAASLTGVAKETISDIERGLRHPHDPTLAKIAKGYGVPIEELIEEPPLLERALDAARRDEEKQTKAVRRLFAGEGVLKATHIVDFEEDRFRAELRESGLPDELFEELVWPLVLALREAEQKAAQVEEKNARLEADLAKVRA
jgi:transcriptional regulator with XRE-family HTH domain